jgi:hypothetical protein
MTASAAGDFDRSDIKVSEMAPAEDGRLIVLERGSATTKLYLVQLDPTQALDPRHLDVATRPTLEEHSAAGDLERHVPVLAKKLILSTDDLPEVSPDIEGMIVLSPHALLLVNDNDFGIEDVGTTFWKVDLPSPM